MKKIWIVLLFLTGSTMLYGQSFQNNKRIQGHFNQAAIQLIPTQDFSVAFTKKSGNSFYAYNKATGLNDTFSEYRNHYTYSRSTLVFSNQFRGIKVDSFNPYGVDNPGTAIVTGILQLLF